MRESALFGTMFGLGAGAVLVGVTVSRLVVGAPPDKSAEEPLAAVTETAPTLAAETARPAKVEPPPVVSSVAPPPAEIAPPRAPRTAPRKHRRPSVVEETPATIMPVVPEAPPTIAPVVQEPPSTTASVAKPEALPAEPPRAEVRDAAITSGPPIAIVRGGAARLSPAPGARVIQVEPQDRAR